MRAPTRTLALLLGVAALTARAGSAAAQAGGTIKAGTAFFTQGASPANAAANPPVAAFRVDGAASTSHVFNDWWWYRINGIDTRENALNGATASNFVGATGTFDFSFARFDAKLTYKIGQSAPKTGALSQTLAIKNTSANRFNISLYHFIDVDLNGTAFNDAAKRTGFLPTTIHATDGATNVNADLTSLADYWVDKRTTILGAMTDNVAGDPPANQGLPFAAGDDMAVLWEISSLFVEPGDTRTVNDSMFVSLVATPEPESLGLVAAGAAAVLALGLRARRLA